MFKKIIKKKVHKKFKLQQKIHRPETTRNPTVSVSLAVPSQHLNYSLGHGVSQHEGWTCILDGLEGLTIHPWTIVARLNPKTVNVEVFEHQGQSIGNLCDRAPSNHGSKGQNRWMRSRTPLSMAEDDGKSCSSSRSSGMALTKMTTAAANSPSIRSKTYDCAMGSPSRTIKKRSAKIARTARKCLCA